MKKPLQKIRLAGLKKHYKILMQELHRRGVVHIVENQEFIDKNREAIDEHFGVFDLARLDFVIDFLTPYAKNTSKLEALLSGGMLILPEEEAKIRLKEFAPKSEALIEECEKIEESIVRSENELTKITAHLQLLEKFLDMDTEITSDFSTEKTTSWVGSVSVFNEGDFLEALAGISHLVDIKLLTKTEKASYLRITAFKEFKTAFLEVFQMFKFEEIDFVNELGDYLGQKPADVTQALIQKSAELQDNIAQKKQKITELAQYLEEFKILSDYNTWKKRKNDVQKEIFYSQSVFAFEGWIPKDHFDDFKKWIKNAFVGEVSIEKTKPQEEEAVPVLMENNAFIRAFEPIIDMFGLPNNKEFDPTPFTAPFFLLFFGICLSDVGYGLILVLASSFFLIFSKFNRAAKDGLRLLLFSGIFAIIGGVLLGSYFGMDPQLDPVPTFLLKDNWQNLDAPFKGQILNPMEAPLVFMGFTIALGVIQIAIGLLINIIQKISLKDTKGTLFAINKILVFIGAILFALMLFTGKTFGMSAVFIKYAALAGGGYLIFGGFLSNLLSYSRLMALGLATGVVGGVMNLTAGVIAGMMPLLFLKILAAVLVLVSGHALNFALSLLGSFVHTGRLQFIEYFGNFFEAGGKKFEPFARKNKYLQFRNHQ